MYGRVQAMQLLLDAGAIALAEDGGARAVEDAVRGDHLDAALLLIRHGAALPDDLDPDKWRALAARLADEVRAAAVRSAEEARAADEARRGLQALAVGAAGEMARVRAQREAADAARAAAAAERAALARERAALAASATRWRTRAAGGRGGRAGRRLNPRTPLTSPL